MTKTIRADKKKSTQPAIRFKGFKEEWQGKALNEVGELNPSSELPEKFNYVDLESVKGTSLLNIRQETKKSAPSRAQRLAKKGDVFYQTVRPYQKNNYLFNLSGDYVFSTGYAQIRPKIDSSFLISKLQTESFVNEVLKRCTGTSYPAINSTDLATLKINVPQKEEQTKIGALFQKIDQAIELQSDQLASQRRYKEAMLQKLFPQKGKTTPELRFKGFTEKWGKDTLGNLIEIFNTKRIPVKESERKEGVTPYYGANGIQSYIDGCTHDGEFVLLAEDGANDLNNYPVRFVSGKIWVNNHAHVISAYKNKANNLYLVNALKKVNMAHYLVGGGRAKLNQSALVTIKVFKSSLKEQEKIGAFFQHLDRLIETSETRLTTYQNLKKPCFSGCLFNFFLLSTNH